jgi:hypothetical protein
LGGRSVFALPIKGLHLKEDSAQLISQMRQSVPAEQTQTPGGFNLKYSFVSADSAFTLSCVETYGSGVVIDNFCDLTVDPSKSKSGTTVLTNGGYLPLLTVEFQDEGDKSMIGQITQPIGVLQSRGSVDVAARDGKKFTVNMWELRAGSSTSSNKTTFTVVP